MRWMRVNERAVRVPASFTTLKELNSEFSGAFTCRSLKPEHFQGEPIFACVSLKLDPSFIGSFAGNVLATAPPTHAVIPVAENINVLSLRVIKHSNHARLHRSRQCLRGLRLSAVEEDVEAIPQQATCTAEQRRERCWNGFPHKHLRPSVAPSAHPTDPISR
jgi:hypothetical protein